MPLPLLAAAAAPQLMGALGAGGASSPSVGGGSGPKASNMSRLTSDATSSALSRLTSGAGQRGGYSNVFSPHGSGEINTPSLLGGLMPWALGGAAVLFIILILRHR